MVLAEEDAVGPDAQALLDEMADPQLVAEPGDHRLAEDLVRPREGGQAGDEEPLELDERLFEEDDVVDVAGGEAGLTQAEVDGVLGELVIVFLPREAFFLGGGDQHPVAKQGGGGVVEVAGQPEDVHLELSPRPLESWRAGLAWPPSLRRPRLEAQRVSEEPDREGERRDDEEVEDREEDPRLSVADLVRDPFPASPEVAENVNAIRSVVCCVRHRHARVAETPFSLEQPPGRSVRISLCLRCFWSPVALDSSVHTSPRAFSTTVTGYASSTTSRRERGPISTSGRPTPLISRPSKAISAI